MKIAVAGNSLSRVQLRAKALQPRFNQLAFEIGCLELVNRVPSGRTYHAYFNPQRPMPPAADATTGLRFHPIEIIL